MDEDNENDDEVLRSNNYMLFYTLCCGCLDASGVWTYAKETRCMVMVTYTIFLFPYTCLMFD